MVEKLQFLCCGGSKNRASADQQRYTCWQAWVVVAFVMILLPERGASPTPSIDAIKPCKDHLGSPLEPVGTTGFHSPLEQIDLELKYRRLHQVVFAATQLNPPFHSLSTDHGGLVPMEH